MFFTYTKRGANGALDTGTLEASSREEAFSILKKKNIIPVSLQVGVPQKIKRHHRFPFMVLAAALLISLLLTVFLLRENHHSLPVKTDTRQTAKTKLESAHPVETKKTVRVPVSSNTQQNVAQTSHTALPAEHGIPSNVGTNLPTPPSFPTPVFNNASDQVLAMLPPADGTASAPPLPMGRDMDAEFLESLKTPIEILPTDDEQTKALKESVIATRTQLKELIDSGMTVAQVLREHQELANQNAKIRNEATLELKGLIDQGDLEGAKAYKEKINAALQQMGIAALSIPLTEEERAERAAIRRENMLRRRAAQAAAQEKIQKD